MTIISRVQYPTEQDVVHIMGNHPTRMLHAARRMTTEYSMLLATSPPSTIVPEAALSMPPQILEDYSLAV